MAGERRKRGFLLSFEGIEGCGKTTQLRRLAHHLRSLGYLVIETREPGGSEGAEKIRELLLGGADERWDAQAEALLFAAARADHVQKTITPALEAGRWVLSDRFVDSSLAYQGGAGGLGIEAVREINAFGIGDCFPDRTLILIDEAGAERARARDTDGSDRIGGRGVDYHHRVELAFRLIAAEESERVRLIDASGDPGQVTARLLDAVQDLLP